MDPLDEMLRTYGVLPEMAVPAAGVVRSRLTLGNVIGQWVAMLLFGVGPIVLGVWLLARLDYSLGGLACLCGFVLGGLTARGANAWVELDGDTLRWKHLFTRQVDERDIGDIDSIVTLLSARATKIDQRLAQLAFEKIFGRIRGFEIRFHGRRRGVQIWRADPAMTNVRELLEAVLAKMCQLGNVVPEAIAVDGIPLVRRLMLERD